MLILTHIIQCKCKYNTVQYNTVQYNTVQYNTVQYSTIQYNAHTCTSLYSTLYSARTYRSDIKAVQGSGLEPLPEVVLLDARLCLEDGQRDGPLCDRGSVGLLGDDEATAEASVLHHLVPQELMGCVRENVQVCFCACVQLTCAAHVSCYSVHAYILYVHVQYGTSRCTGTIWSPWN